MMNRRIALFSPMFRNPGKTHGGITPTIISLAGALQCKGFDVDLLIKQRKGFIPPRGTVPNNVNVIPLGVESKVRTGIALRKYIIKSDPYVVLSAGHSCNLSACIAKMLTPRAKVILRVENNVSVGAKQKGYIHYWARIISICIFYRFANGIITVSKGIETDLINHTILPISKLTTIYNPIIDQKFLEKSEQKIGHPWLVEKTIPVIIGVGRLHHQKSFSTLISAFALVLKKRPCRLIILGEGPERDRLQKHVKDLKIEDNVLLPGFVQNAVPYIKQSDVFVLSSIYEGFGNVVAEALAVGTSVVSTRCPSGPDEILENGKYGNLVRVGKVEEMAQAIIHSLDQPSDKGILISAAQRFHVDKIIDDYIEYFGLT